MVKRNRDYKAEYRRQKNKATSAGYKSVREYGQVRKELALPPRTSPIPKRILVVSQPQVMRNIQNPELVRLRRESAAWSHGSSRVENSKYSSAFSSQQVRDYHGAFVDNLKHISRRKRGPTRRDNIKFYLTKWKGVTETVWQQQYELAPV